MPQKRTLTPERKKQLEEIRELERTGRVRQAFDRLDELMRDAPDDFYLWFRRVTMAVSHSSPETGLAVAQEFRTRFPDDRNAGLVMAMALLEPPQVSAEQAETALQHLDEAESLGGATDRSRSLRRKALSVLGRSAEARAVAASGTGLEALWAQSRTDGPKTEGEMEALAARFRELGEKEHLVLGFVGNWYAGQGRLDRAAEVFQAALREFPDNVRLAFRLAMVERGRGRTHEAIQCLEALLERNPAEPEVAGTLVQLLKERGQRLKAMQVSWAFAKAQALQEKKLLRGGG